MHHLLVLGGNDGATAASVRLIHLNEQRIVELVRITFSVLRLLLVLISFQLVIKCLELLSLLIHGSEALVLLRGMVSTCLVVRSVKRGVGSSVIVD